MTKKQKLAVLFGKTAAAPAIFLLMLAAGSTTAYAADYDLYIGRTQVTDANAGDIFGDGTAKYDAGTKTLTLNGVHISADNYHEVSSGKPSSEINHYSMYAGEDVVRHLVINGNNSFVSAGSEKVYRFVAKATDEWDCTADSNGDGKIDREDVTPADPAFYSAESGIHFSATGTEENAFTITGTGTLTSTATEGYCHDYDVTTEDFLGAGGSRREENLGTALTIAGSGWVFIGNADGTGPRLELTGWDEGAHFGNASKFAMQGGTIIAKAKSPTMGTGVQLPNNSNFFEGGTIAAYGTYDAGKNKGGAFSPTDGKFDTTESKEHGMQRVYPATLENDETDIYDDTRPLKIRGISGYAIVGMTADAFKGSTDAVLAELQDELGGTGGSEGGGTDPTNPDEPGTGGGTGGSESSGGSYHTDTLPGSTDIDVLGFTKNETVYSVDVEWGAMTFEYEKSTWDAETHTTKPGRGWLVYDSVNKKVLGKAGEVRDSINSITVTNHSNAEVFATLSYTGNDGYTDITGGFTTKDGDTVTAFTAAADPVPAYLTLATANNGTDATGGVGTATVGTVYFTPTGIGKTGETVNDITQWTKIGKITVGILTAQPQSQT